MQDPSYTRRDVQGIDMYVQVGSCPDGACIVIRMISALHRFDDNDIREKLDV